MTMAAPDAQHTYGGQSSFAGSGSLSPKVEAAKAAMELTKIILRDFADIPTTGDGEETLRAIMDASRKTLVESERRGLSVPADVKQRLDDAEAVLPATFEFFKQLREISPHY